MCGIVGALGRGGTRPELLDAMSRCVAHRGPDSAGRWTDERAGIGLAHRRLAVLGPGTAGSQPMASASGRFVVVHNGELYNHLDLRRRLDGEGLAPAWRGRSDTETLLAGIEAWGLRATLQLAVGMWALAVWDRERGTLQLARDRMGEKPLSHVRVGSTFAFASQPSALEQVPGFSGEVDRDALADLLRFGCIPGDRGIHVGVHKVPPGSIITVGADGLPSEPEPYWSFLDAARQGIADPLPGGDADRIDAVGEHVREAVAAQLISDVPIGAFLSGGIDSSLVVAMMQRESTRPVRTFTVGFPDTARDESEAARKVARHLGTDHTEVVLSARELLDIVPELPRMYDEPFADSSQIPTALVSRVARRDVTVALSGDGGDELFAGYVRYSEAERLARVPRIVGLGAAIAYGALGQSRRRTLGIDVASGDWAIIRRYLSVHARAERLISGVDASRRRDAFLEDWSRTEGLGTLTERAMALDSIRYLPDDILHKIDRASMSIALETRVPLLDHRLVQLAWRLPLELKVRDGTGKWVLKELLARDLPRPLFERPKRGFSVPIGAWLNGPLRDWADDLLSVEALRREGLIDVTRARRILSDHRRGRWDAGSELWPLLMFRAWSDARRTPQPPSSPCVRA